MNERQQLSSHQNGVGIWIHQTKATDERKQQENLPPISKQRQSQQHLNKARNPIADVETKVEKSLVSVLEQKYQDAIQLLDKAEIKKDRAVFECEMAKKEKT